MKNVSLGTSKINYIDPRITIAFMKKNNIEINKLFTSALQDKFTWALEVETNYIFQYYRKIYTIYIKICFINICK